MSKNGFILFWKGKHAAFLAQKLKKFTFFAQLFNAEREKKEVNVIKRQGQRCKNAAENEQE